MSKFCWSRAGAVAGLLSAVWMVASGPVAAAAIACPVMLYGGSRRADTITLSFENRGKAPIRRVDFDCAPSASRRAKRTACHTESGLFYPGTPYSVSFPYRSKGSATVIVSLSAALLPGGVSWMAIHDQPCRPLRVRAR